MSLNESGRKLNFATNACKEEKRLYICKRRGRYKDESRKPPCHQNKGPARYAGPLSFVKMKSSPSMMTKTDLRLSYFCILYCDLYYCQEVFLMTLRCLFAFKAVFVTEKTIARYCLCKLLKEMSLDESGRK